VASLLESSIRNQVAAALRGQLLTCILRRVASTALDDYGDPVPGTATTYSFDGMRDTFRAEFAVASGIPVTDAKILIVAGSLATIPTKDDQVKIRDQWYQLRRITAQDPAGATYEFAGYEITDPTV
jgi:hypothetical protein